MKKWCTMILCFGLIALLVACQSKISKEEAYNIALKDAGVSESDVTLTKEVVDEDEFQFEFHTAEQAFEYEINEDGTIEKREVTSYQASDADKENTTGEEGTAADSTIGGTDAGADQTTTTPVTQEQALERAYTHFKVSQEDVTNLEVRQERDDGQEVYDIEFHVGNKEYSCDVSVQTGEILSYDIDNH